MNVTKKLLLVVFIAAALVGCGGKGKIDSVKTKRVDISQSPLGTFKQIAEVEEIYDPAQEHIANAQPVPLHFSELITLLPQSPAGWTAEPADGETNFFNGYGISQASRTYNQGDRKMKVRVTDSPANPKIHASALVSSNFSQESSEGYNKGLNIGNFPGREEYKYKNKQGTLTMLVHKRFLVEIEGKNVEPQDLQQWWNAIEKKEMSALNSQS